MCVSPLDSGLPHIDSVWVTTMGETLALQDIYIWTKATEMYRFECWKVYEAEGLMCGSRVLVHRGGSGLRFHFLLIIDRLDGNRPGPILCVWERCGSGVSPLRFYFPLLLFVCFSTCKPRDRFPLIFLQLTSCDIFIFQQLVFSVCRRKL